MAAPNQEFSSTQDQPRAPRIELATVISYDQGHGTLTIRTEHTGRTIEDVPYCVPYCHVIGSEGLNFFPEPGSDCYLFYPTDGSSPFVLGWRMSFSPEEGYRGGRADVTPGDVVLATRDKNFVALKRGGVVAIGGNALSQRLYIPLANLIRDIFGQYEALSPLGSVSWKHADIEADPTGKTRVKYHLDTRRYAEDADPVLVVEAGYLDQPAIQESPVLLNIELRRDGNATFGIELLVDSSGSVRLRAHAKVELTAETGDFEIKAKKAKVLIEGQTEVKITSPATVTVEAPAINCNGKVTVSGDLSTDGDVSLGSLTAAEQAVLGNKLHTWLAAANFVPVSGAGAPYKVDLVSLTDFDLDVLSGKVKLG